MVPILFDHALLTNAALSTMLKLLFQNERFIKGDADDVSEAEIYA